MIGEVYVESMVYSLPEAKLHCEQASSEHASKRKPM